MTEEQKKAEAAKGTETPEQKELRELKEQNAALIQKNATLEEDLNSLIDGSKNLGESVLAPLESVGKFPGNIEVLKLKRDQYKNPIGYDTIEVPEDLANVQLRKPIGERNPHYRDLCFKEEANQALLR
jgi:hypothetical protein